MHNIHVLPWQSNSILIENGRENRTKLKLLGRDMVDDFTKAVEFACLLDSGAGSVARVVHDPMFMRYGLPEWVTTDNGTEFLGVFRHRARAPWGLGVDHVQTSPYPPHFNGAAERLLHTMKTMLAAKVSGATHDWPALLPQTRTRVHATATCVDRLLT